MAFGRIMARVTMTRIRILILMFFVGGLVPLFPMAVLPATAGAGGECIECHGDSALTASRGGREVSLFVDETVYAASIHGVNGVTCQDCHADVTDKSHTENPADLADVRCGSCHNGQADKHQRGIHAVKAGVGKGGADCKDCHGMHDIRSAKDPTSRVFPLNIADTCGICHANANIVGAKGVVFDAYEEGQHGISTRKGMRGAAVCTDCHGSHEVLPASNPKSSVSKKGSVATCGRCHIGAMQVYNASVHGRSIAAGVDEAPSCADCHSPHRILRVDKEEFLLATVDRCGGCHSEASTTYLASYHGQVADLGFTRVAKCVDCHGTHNVLPPANPESMVGAARVLDTCRQCHPKAGPNFVGFAPHLNHSDKIKYPVESAVFGVMSALLINVFLIFGIHTLLWFIRGIFVKIRHEGPPHLGNPSGRYFLRFNYYHRITHFLIFTSFVVLSVTGLPLKFHHAEWAKMLAAALGGFKVAGVLHRMMGLVTFGYFAMHLGFVAYLWLSGRMKLLEMLWGPKSIVPHPKDAADIAGNIKWFLGLGPQPKFGRFTYWEKFDYLAVFWGVAVIGLSGLVLWFPEQFTQVLPGMVVNLAWIIHADEALLATGFIFLIHFFNTHLRVEKFPLDPVILTGRIDEEEMRHERPLEFAMRRADGSLREIQTTATPLWMKNFARAVGWTFVFIGFALLIGMIASLFS